jgi:hypothetical protein
MCGKDAKPKRTCACQKCGAELDAGLRGPLKKWCMMCRKTPPCRKIPTCRHCGVVTGLSLKRRWPITVCQDCKDEHAKARAKRYKSLERGCVRCGSRFIGAWARRLCDPCLTMKKTAATVACVECGTVFRKSRQGGNSKGLFCTNRCHGIHRRRVNGAEARMRQRQRFMRIAKHERAAMHRQRRMRQELEKIVAFVVKRALTPCRDCGCSLPLLRGYGVSGGWRLFRCDGCSQARRKSNAKTARKSRLQRLRDSGVSVNPKHGSRAKRRGLPRMYGKSVTLGAVGDRDGWVCQLCGSPVDRTQDRNHPHYPCIDHIVPLGHKGNRSHGHVLNNIQIAHRSCNSAKGCRIACPSLLDCSDPREHVRVNRIDQTIGDLRCRVGSVKNGPFRPEPHATSTRVSVG